MREDATAMRAPAFVSLLSVVACTPSPAPEAPPAPSSTVSPSATAPLAPTPVVTSPAPMASASVAPAAPQVDMTELPRVQRPAGWIGGDGRCETACDVFYFVPPGARHAGRPLATVDIDVGKGKSRYPIDPRIDMYGVVLDGDVSLSLNEDPKGAATLRPWRAFHAKGGGITLSSTGGAEARVVVAFVRVDGKPLVDILPDAEADKPPRMTYTAKRKEAPEIVDLASAKDLSWKSGAYHARLGFESAPASLGLLYMAASAGVATHQHDKEWECLFVVQGSGKMIGGGPIAAPQSVCVRPGEQHGFEGGGTSPFLAIQLYTPPGPEQRFRKLSSQP